MVKVLDRFFDPIRFADAGSFSLRSIAVGRISSHEPLVFVAYGTQRQPKG